MNQSEMQLRVFSHGHSSAPPDGFNQSELGTRWCRWMRRATSSCGLHEADRRRRLAKVGLASVQSCP